MDECKQWLQQEHQELFARLYGQEEIEAKLDGLTVSPDQQSAVDAEKQSNNKKKKKNVIYSYASSWIAKTIYKSDLNAKDCFFNHRVSRVPHQIG